MTRNEIIRKIKKAYQDKNLTLYLGSGISVANGLLSWDKLVLALYFRNISKQKLGDWKPYPNYLFAISEFILNNKKEPLEITARKINCNYKKKTEFLKDLKETLYAAYYQDIENNKYTFTKVNLLNANLSLKKIADLCDNGGVSNVISYNYDNLLETVLDNYSHKPIWSYSNFESDVLPIYHVHGYIPFNEHCGSKPNQIIFTEDQYHFVAQDPYNWSNLVQIKCMSSSIGLMIGLSLSDRNMRRLFDAVKNAPYKKTNFALLQRPQNYNPSNDELDKIHYKAVDYKNIFENSGIKITSGIKGPDFRAEIRGIFEEVESKGLSQQEKVLNQLGINPIWYSDHSEIPDILSEFLR
jgi:hypothetical protein